jgi:hypothetical protein
MSPIGSSGDISSSNNYIKIMIVKIFFFSFVHDIKVLFLMSFRKRDKSKELPP